LSIEMTLQKAEREKKLKNNVDWYSSIVEGIGRGIIVIDIKGMVKFLNPFAENLTHWKSNEILDKNYREIFKIKFPGSQDYADIPFDDVIMDNKIENSRPCLLYARDDTEIPIQYSLLPLTNQNNVTIGIIILFAYDDSDVLPFQSGEGSPEKETKKQAEGLFGKGEWIENIRVYWYHKTKTYPKKCSFDIFRLGTEHIGFYIFDISWYGLTSALFARNFKRFLSPDTEQGGILLSASSDGTEKILPPLTVLKELNRRFYFEGEGSPFFTAVYAVTEIKTGKTELVRAGYPYPIYLQNDGKLILIQSEGGALGMFSDMDAAEYEFDFEPGSRLFLYSEGLIDSNYANLNEGAFKRFLAFLEETKKYPLQEQVNELGAVEKKWHEHTPLPEEILFVVLERE
jgi:hypothetical protein